MSIKRLLIAGAFSAAICTSFATQANLDFDDFIAVGQQTAPLDSKLGMWHAMLVARQLHYQGSDVSYFLREKPPPYRERIIVAALPALTINSVNGTLLPHGFGPCVGAIKEC